MQFLLWLFFNAFYQLIVTHVFYLPNISGYLGNMWSDPEAYGSNQLLTHFPFVPHICINEMAVG